MNEDRIILICVIGAIVVLIGWPFAIDGALRASERRHGYEPLPEWSCRTPEKDRHPDPSLFPR